MELLVQRYVDDGYGNTHLVEEGKFGEELYNDIQNAESDSEIYENLLGFVPETDIDLSTIGNPRGCGNVVDEYRIYLNGELYKTI